MRDKFIAYYQPTEQEFVELWEKCLFVLDTNVLLNLYRHPQQARDDFFKAFEKLSNRLWIPHQVALEYQENRLRVIADQKKKFNEVRDIVDKNIGALKSDIRNLQLRKRHATINPDDFLTKIEEQVSQFRDELERLNQIQPDVSSKDTIRDKIDELFMGKIGEPFSKDRLEEIFKDNQFRKDRGMPPGYRDTEKEEDERPHHFWNGTLIPRECGDLILWHQIIEHAKKAGISHVVFVTDDEKDDWWWKVKSQGPKTIGPRPELVSEIMSKADVARFYMYNSAKFLEYAKQYLKMDISAESIEQVQDTLEQVRYELEFRGTVPPINVKKAVFMWVQNSHPNDEIRVHEGEVDFIRVGREHSFRTGYAIKFPYRAIRTYPLTTGFLRQVPNLRQTLNLDHLMLILALPHEQAAASWIDAAETMLIPPHCSVVVGFMVRNPYALAPKDPFEFVPVVTVPADDSSEPRV